jgi:hypothetical protein
MSKRPRPKNYEIDQELADRLIAAFASLFFSLPFCAILAILSVDAVPLNFWIWPIILLATLGFVAPRLLPHAISWIAQSISCIMSWWQ